jgi:hypothetical protein
MKQSQGGQEIKAGSGEYKKWLFTGLVDVKPLVFNPTKEQIKEIRGYEPQQEPAYYNQSFPSTPDEKFSKIELLCSFNPRKASITKELPEGNVEFPEQAFATISFNISKAKQASKTGKVLMINSEVRYDGIWSTWAESIETIDSKFEYSTEDLREAHVGERCLLNLLYALYKESSKDAPITGFGILDTAWEDICDGDVSELNSIIDSTHTNSEQFRSEKGDNIGQVNNLRVLLGVKASGTGKMFNTVFTSDYDYTFAKAGKSLTKRVKERLTDSFKADYQGDLSFKEYDPLAAANRSAAVPTTTVDTGDSYDTSMGNDEPMPF